MMNGGGIACDRHNPVKRIDFANKMTFAHATNGRVTGHRADPICFLRHKTNVDAAACRGSGRFGPRMPASDNQHINLFHVKHSLAEAKAREEPIEDRVQRVNSKNTRQ